MKMHNESGELTKTYAIYRKTRITF